MRLRQRLCPKAPQDEERGGDYGDGDRHEADCHEGFLPGHSAVARAGDWRKCRSAKNGGERGYEPVSVRAVESSPIGDSLGSGR